MNFLLFCISFFSFIFFLFFFFFFLIFSKKKKKTRALSFHPNVVQLIGYCEEPKCILTKLYERDLFSLLHDQNEGSISLFLSLIFNFYKPITINKISNK